MNAFLIGTIDEIYYADKLVGRSLPVIYRRRSIPTNSTLMARCGNWSIASGAQAAGCSGGSIDRLWEDQSIESCDDWVIALR